MKQLLCKELCFHIMLLSVTKVVGLSSGAPDSACSGFTPGHGPSSASGPVPFLVNISSLDGGYSPEQSYTIILSGSSANANFRGFLIAGRLAADGTTAAGTFVGNGNDQKTTCGANSGATHTSGSDKTMVQLMWTAPSAGSGPILFRYAFVDTFSVYWPDQATSSINEATATVTVPPITVVTFNQSSYSVNENAGLVQLTMVISMSSTSDITVQVTTANVTAFGGGIDYNSGPYNITFSTGVTTVLLNISINDDNILEGNEDFIVSINNSTLPDNVITNTSDTATVTIRDDDMLVVEFSSGQFTGSESSGFIEVIVRVTGGISSTLITVTVTPSEQSPVSAMGSGVDYNSDPFNITINAGAIEGRANISVTCDDVVEGSETFDMRLTLTSGGNGITLGRDTSVGEIMDSTVAVSFSQSSYGVMEDDGTVSLVLALSQPSSVPFEVSINTVDMTALDEEDYNRTSMTINVTTGVVTQTFMINIINNNVVECVERFNVRITSVTTCGVTIGTNNMSEVIITDDDGATVSLSQSQSSIAESDTPLPVTIMMSNRASEDVVVEVTLSDGSADAGVDYAMSSPLMFNVTISAGSLSQSFDVDIINDMIQEDNETFNIAIRVLPSCLSLSLGTSSSTVAIIDNDVAMITFSSSTFSGTESSGVISATVIISGGIVSSRGITVPITFTGGTATGGNVDFDSAAQNAIITAGTNSRTVNIGVTNDNIVEGDEMFTMSLNVPVSPGVVAGAITMATATIIDTTIITVRFTQNRFTGSETTGFIPVNLELNGGSSTSPFTVMVTPSEQSPVSAEGSVDFNATTLIATFASGMTMSSVRVPVINDSNAEGNEEFDLTLTVPLSLSPAITAGNRNAAVGVITDSTVLVVEFALRQFTGSESSGFIEVTVRIADGSSSTPITVTVTPSEQSPVSAMGSGVDFNSDPFNITINAGATEGRANISVTCDDEVEGLETFDMRLTLASSSNGVTLGRDTSVGEIMDSTVEVSFNQPSYEVMEDDGTVSLVIALSQPSSVPFEVIVETINVTAVDEEDYSGDLLIVNVTTGVVTQEIMISIISNSILECIERFNVMITSVTTCGVTIGTNNMSEIVITEDDRATVSLSQSQYSVAESDTPLSVTIMLSNRVSEDVVVEVTLSDGSADAGVDYAMSSPLMFNVTISAGSLSQSFDVDIINDIIQEDNETFNITIRLLPSCLSLSLGTSSSTVAIIDNDVAMITFSSSTFSGTESSGVISVTVIISGGIVSSRNITVFITFTEGTATAGTDFDNTTLTAVISSGSNVTTLAIPIINDTSVEENEAFNISLNVSTTTGITLAAPFTATVVITDTAPPQIVTHPINRTVMINNETTSVSFTCLANGASSYYWRRENVSISSDAEGINSSVLTIHNLLPTDDGHYQCVAVNEHGISVSYIAVLTVEGQYCDSSTEEYTDHGFSIRWNRTLVGNTVEAPCIGTGLNGVVTRSCIEGPEWVDGSAKCFNETTDLLNQAMNLTSFINELNETERIFETNRIANRLVNITAPTQGPILAADINSTVTIISALNNIAESALTSLNTDDTFFEDTTSVIDNLLSQDNADSWKQLGNNSSAGQELLAGVEQLANLLSKTLTGDDVTETVKTKQNIVIKAERISNDDVDDGYTFPDNDDDLTKYKGGAVQLMVAGDLLQDINSTELTLAITVIRNNTGLPLPSSTDRNGGTPAPASAIFSLQIDPLPNSSILETNPIMMTFDVDVPSDEPEQEVTLDDVTCNFYNFTMNSNNLIGGWSTEGVTVDKMNSNRTSVTCFTTHLTSFAVLVSTADEQPTPEDEDLSVFIYIGCGLSLVFLGVSIVTLILMIFKSKNKIKHLFIHLNLCLSLVFGVVTFIAGIERNDDEVPCKVVAALLQYFFISAVSWILCEVVFLYMISVTVCGNKLNKLIFFFILGWGPAIPIVAISAGIAHDHYTTEHFCWIDSDGGTIYAFIGPVAAIMLITCVFMAMTCKALCGKREKVMNERVASKRIIAKDLLRAAVIVLPVLGATWIIGIIVVNDVTQVLEWIFAVANVVLGVLILIFYVLIGREGMFGVCDNPMGTSKTYGMSTTKGKASQDTSNETGSHAKKLTGVDYLSPQKSPLDKPEEMGETEDSNQIKLTTFKRKEELMMERYDAEGESLDNGKHDANKEEKRSITDDIVGMEAGAMKPTPFPRIANN